MTREFQVTYRLPTGRCEREIDRLLAAKGGFAHIGDQSARLKLLAQALVTPSKTYAQTSDHRNRPSGLRRAIQSGMLDTFFAQQRETYLEPLGLWPADPPALVGLPRYSFVLQFTFTLRKPYLSQDDVDWYVIDNPVRKEKVFGLPLVAPTGWKGALRATMIRQLVAQSGSLSDEQFATQRLALALLFGDEKGEEPGNLKALAKYLNDVKPGAASIYRRKLRELFSVEEREPLPHHAGRLYFYPTFFTQISLEVINPHDRETGAGTLPIYFECVRAGAQGTFTLLYVPFDLVGKPEEEVRPKVADDLKAVAKAIEAMFTVYGFGAKTSSGFGVVAPMAEHMTLGLNVLVEPERRPLTIRQEDFELTRLPDAVQELLMQIGGAL